ncbi:MAG: hypothetical protein ACYSUX_11475 [Planctomycetota bacterium]
MHRDHDIFIQGIEQEKRLKLTFFSRKLCRHVQSICAPLHFSQGPAGPLASEKNKLECYYLWDFEAKKDNNFLALSPSEIVSIKLTEDVFHIQEFYSQSSLAEKPANSRDV